MLVKIGSATPFGIEAQSVTVEVNVVGRGLPRFDIIGLTSKTVDESRHRIKAAFLNLKLDFPSNKKITVNLAPADLPKSGSFYDMPISAGLICLSNNINPPSKSLFFGEVSLDGCFRHIKGAFLLGVYAKENDYTSVFVPESNAREVASISGLNVIPVNNLKVLQDHLTGIKLIPPFDSKNFIKDACVEKGVSGLDFSEIVGQEMAKRSLEIAAAGGHNFLMIGPPGVGKTLLSQAFCSILPSLSEKESLEVTKIYSAGGYIPPNGSLITTRPIRSPHHSISYAGMVGGGTIPRPGEISLAHRGVLFMDEFTEFPLPIIEMLRQPLESGFITISRNVGSFLFPCKFVLLMACNPCPCGFFGSAMKECTCSSSQLRRYRKKLSGPILDRVDLFTSLNFLNESDFSVYNSPHDSLLESSRNESHLETSEDIRKRVCAAREIQSIRFRDAGIYCNSEMQNAHIQEYCTLGEEEDQLLNRAVSVYSLSARAYYKTIKISRTIADLECETRIQVRHLAEALQHRIREF